MITTHVEKIGPDEARALLEMNTENFRRPDPKRIDLYAREMSRGNWRMNGDTIKTNGKVLLDGQHRLLDVIKSGVTIETIVVRGLDDAGIATIDRGKQRTIAQYLAHAGFRNSSAAATTSRLLVAYEHDLWDKVTIGNNVIADSEIIDFALLHQDAITQCVRAAAPVKSLMPVSLMAAVLFVGGCRRNPRDIPEAVWFVDGLAKGSMLTEDDAVYHLRNRLLSQTRQSRMDLLMRRALLTIAWNKTVRGELCTSNGMRLRLTGPSRQNAPTHIEILEA